MTLAKAWASLPELTSWLGMVESGVPTICSRAELGGDAVAAVEADHDCTDAEGDQHDAGGDPCVLEELAHGGPLFALRKGRCPSSSLARRRSIRSSPPSACGFRRSAAAENPQRSTVGLRARDDGPSRSPSQPPVQLAARSRARRQRRHPVDREPRAGRGRLRRVGRRDRRPPASPPWWPGALSMAAGEYVSVSSQRDAEQADLRLE